MIPDIQDIMRIAKEAGEVIMPYFKANPDIIRKADGSPVTHADEAAEQIILTALAKLTPDIPIVAEELAEAGLAPDITGHDTYWLVDPLDGTKEFLKGTDNFVVNIGLVHQGTPVLGVVYQPATGDIYYGGKGIGAFKNDIPITVQNYDETVGLTIIGNQTPVNKTIGKARAAFLKDFRVSDYVTKGSSIKFCMVAEGAAHLYVRFVPTYEWDTCAGHAILLQCGGDIVDFDTRSRLPYGKPNFLNGNLITGTHQVLKILNP